MKHRFFGGKAVRRITYSICICFVAVLSGNSVGWADEVHAHTNSPQPFVQWLTTSLEQGGDVTALRQEQKLIVTPKAAKQFFARFQQEFGPLEMRDTPLPGEENMTSTDYLDTGKLLAPILGYETIPEGSISPKIRLRRYLSRNAEGRARRIAMTDGVTVMEFKIPHPEKVGVSLKSRLFVNDRHLRSLLGKRWLAEPQTRAQIVATLKADSRNDAETVDRMVSVLETLHRRHQGGRMKPQLQIEYQRNAYSLRLPGDVELQFTFDRDVTYRDPIKGKTVHTPRWRSIEIKTPESLVQLSDTQLVARGLGAISTVRSMVRDLLEPNRVSGLKANGGKNSAFRQERPRVAERMQRRSQWK